MTEQIQHFLILSKQEKYIIGKSLIDSWGYPYILKKVKFLFDREVYKRVNERLQKMDYVLKFEDLSIIINSLDMLYYDNGDFVALYDDITKDDVNALRDKLKKFITGWPE
ncbi:MAG: hypothetical protein C3F02_00495 [Parcubacteria group bacterium]|nr:MAG: hypothetical protein C3F02_00495 [Parcubacteria group bacterium]